MNLKKALKHDVEVAGKTIPTMILVGLFLVGGGSAALLSSFGTVSGTADVNQAIQIGSDNVENGDAQVKLLGESDTVDVTAGSTEVETFKVKNNMDSSYDLTYTSYPGESSVPTEESSPTTLTGAQISWDDSGENSDGITTTFANYFADAGASDGYEAPEEDTGNSVYVVSSESDFTDLSVVKSASEVDKPQADYVITESAEIYASEDVALTGEGNQPYVVQINADDVTFSGFSVDPSDSQGAIKVYRTGNDNNPSGAVISHNDFTGSYDSDGSNNAVWIQNTEGAEVSNNTFSNWDSGVYVSGADSETKLVHNTFEDNRGGVAGTENFAGAINYNLFRNNVEGIGVGDDEFSTTGNRFDGNTASLKIWDTGDYSNSISVDADNNFFQEPYNIEYDGDMEEGDVSVSYEQVESVPADETVKVAAVSEFPLMLSGSTDYSLTTTIS